MPKIFLSYRRSDGDGAVNALFDALAKEFGRDSLFMDVDAIPVGMDFRNVLRDAVAESDLMLVCIGRHWVAASDDDGRRRLDDPHDFVRMEIEQALQVSVPVIPILLDGARMPQASEVPDSLRPLLYRMAVTVSAHSFRSDLQEVVRAIKANSLRRVVETSATSPPHWKVKVLSAMASLLGLSSSVNIAPVHAQDHFLPKAEPGPPVHIPQQDAEGDDEVFVSYAREDGSIMQKVRLHLAQSEISVWTDEKLEPGTPSWKTAVQDAIEKSTCFVILLSPNAKKSEIVQMELGYALAHERKVIPALAHGTNRTAVPLEIINRQWIDITEHRFEDGVLQLAQAVIHYRAGRIPPRFVNDRR